MQFFNGRKSKPSTSSVAFLEKTTPSMMLAGASELEELR